MLYAIDKGVGPPIVFLHGIAGSARYWEPYIDGLSKTNRVIALDLLGYGRSPESETEYTPQTHCEAIDKTLQSLQVDVPAVFVGHSMGSVLALECARRRPSAVERLILCSMPIYTSATQARSDITKNKRRLQYTYYGNSSRLLCTTWCKTLRPFSRHVARLYLRKFPKHVAEDSVLHTWDSYSQTMSSVVENQDIAKAISAIDAPIELVYGTNERKTILDNAAQLQQRARVNLEMLEGTHNLPLEQVGAIITKIKKISSL